MNECPFCECSSPVLENDLAFVRPDKYPVSEGHLLICPRRHFADFFEASQAERKAIFSLLQDAKALSTKTLRADGYNIGINCGVAAGQTVMHLHVHLIPRYHGDMPDPRGGVRGVIPAKQKY
jgi:diadenosine tetraphosphate (Ap4A) HIT family hydrolase